MRVLSNQFLLKFLFDCFTNSVLQRNTKKIPSVFSQTVFL